MYIKLRVEQSTSRTQSQWWCHQLLRIPFKATTQILWPKNLSMHSLVVSCFYYRQSTRRCTLGSTLELLGGAWHLVVKGSRRMHVAIWQARTIMQVDRLHAVLGSECWTKHWLHEPLSLGKLVQRNSTYRTCGVLVQPYVDTWCVKGMSTDGQDT